VVALVGVAPQALAQAPQWAPPKCDLKPGHQLVNSGQMYLKSATQTRFEDQRQKDLRDAANSLTQAVTTGNQASNPAAWYYLGRYYLMVQDLQGADSAFSRAEALKPDCKTDITTWRRIAWVPLVNAGIAAWQANNTDSAMAALRRANMIVHTEPMGYKYLASLLYNAGQADSALVYFRRAADVAASDTAYLQDRKDALYNLARIQHSLARSQADSLTRPQSAESLTRMQRDNQKRWADAEAAYREYLTLVPADPEVQASLGSVLMQTGQRDSAFALYRRVIAQGDTLGSISLFRAGVEIYQGAPETPDTVAMGRSCRGRGQGGQGQAARQAAAARVRACRDSMAVTIRDYNAVATATYRMAAQAFEAGLKLNPYFRDGLYNVVNTYMTLNDSALMLPAAQRLFGVDPLNRSTIRLLAFAHQRVGHLDSTLHYLRLSDSTLAVDVSVTQFDPVADSVSIKGLLTNQRPVATQPFKLVFEFLNGKGEVVATQSTDVAAIAPQQAQPFELKATGRGILAWRYRRQ
jgi:tetratricopeptide (TPR) repeat protein